MANTARSWWCWSARCSSPGRDLAVPQGADAAPGARALGCAACRRRGRRRRPGPGFIAGPGRLMDWRPTASLPTLHLRAELLACARSFFAERGVLEVDTPALVRHAVTDRHIHSAQVRLPGHGAPLFLHSSPEYAMKRLLAAGSGDIYQIA